MLGWALATFVKGMKIRLRKKWLSFWMSEKSPSVEIAGGVMNLWLIMMDIGCAVYDVVYVIKAYESVSMHDIFNHSWIVEVLLALPCGMVMVAVLLGVHGEVTVGLHVVGWGGARVGHVIHSTNPHRS